MEDGGELEITICDLKRRSHIATTFENSGMATKNNGTTLGFEETLWQAVQARLEVTLWRLKFLGMRSHDD
jgi:hypothetical protein